MKSIKMNLGKDVVLANHPPKKMMNNKNKERIFIFVMLLWPILHFLVFWLYVNFSTIVLTFQRFNTSTGTIEWYGFNRFVDLFKDMILGENKTLQTSLFNSLLFFPVQNFIILPLSFICAFFLSKKIKGSNAFRIIFFLPSILSIVVLTMCFKFMFNAEFGPVNMMLENLFVTTPDWFSAMSGTAMPMVFLFCVWAGLGYNVLLINGAISRIPTEITESAKIDGVGILKEMIYIVFPLAWPTIGTLFILGTLGVFGFFIQPMLLVSKTGGFMGSTSTVALQVLNYVQNSNASDAAAIGLFFSLLGIPVVLLIKRFVDKLSENIEF